MRLTHEIGHGIGLTDDNGIERLRYDYGSAPKPFLHPLRLPDGTVLTAHEPADHPWHRGLWFAFKFVNGINYWEEGDDIIGRQKAFTPHALSRPDQVFQVSGVVAWQDQETMRLQEFRQWSCQLDESGNMTLTWLTRLTAQEPVTLDRTPFTTWGGYGGLFVRLRDDLQDARLVFDDGTVTTKCTGERHRWGAIEGTTPDGKNCAVVFVPDKSNTRWPEPFYGHARPDYHFFGPAPLFHEALSLPAGETLSYGVRVLVLPHRIGTFPQNQDTPWLLSLTSLP